MSSELGKVNQKVYQQFSELAGVKPSISSRPNGEKLYVYQGKAALPNGKFISRVVRVVVSEKGCIVKLTSSH